MTHHHSAPVMEARLLTAQEEYYAKLSLAYPINPVLVAHLSGSATTGSWRSALDEVQALHPLLSARIVPLEGRVCEPTRLKFAFEPGVAIPLRIRPLDAGPSWEEVVERELCEPFQFTTQPLIRATLLEGSAECVLVLTAFHAILDGLSLTFVLRDILSALKGERRVGRPPPPSAEAILGFPPMARPSPDPERLLGAETPLETDRPSFTARSIEGDAARALLRVCKARGATLNGALVAATIMSLRQCEARHRDGVIKIVANTDSRAMLGLTDDVGLYFQTLSMDAVPSPDPDVWEIARMAMGETRVYADRAAIASNTEKMRKGLSDGLTASEAKASLVGEPKDAVVTNLGRMRFGSDYGRFALKRVSLGVLTGRPLLQVIGAATIDDTLSLTLTSRHPVPGLLDGVVETLLGL